MTQQLGKLAFQPAHQAAFLLGMPVNSYLQKHGFSDVLVSGIDSKLADTAAFCDHYAIDMNMSANCVIVEAKRGDKTWYAACVILATSKADINGTVRKTLNARKVSFAPMETATSLTHMEYGGITPIGLPDDWLILIDEQVLQQEKVILGSGIRGSKVLITSDQLQNLLNAKVLDISKK